MAVAARSLRASQENGHPLCYASCKGLAMSLDASLAPNRFLAR